MTWTDQRLGEIYRSATSSRSRADCPSGDDLVRAAFEGGTAEILADHLGGCAACADEYRALRSMAPARTSTNHPGPYQRWAMAATVLLAIALGVLALTLSRRNAELTARLADAAREQPVPSAPRPIDVVRAPATPQINVAVIDLLPSTAVVRGENERSVANVPADAEAVTLIINVEEAAVYPEYGAELVDAGGKAVFNVRGLRLSAHDTFTLHVPRGMLDPGTYQVRLYGVRHGVRLPIESYPLRFLRK